MTQPKKTSRPSNLLPIRESQAHLERPMTGFGLWRLGFRPFYLGGAFFSAIAILLWLRALFGHTGTVNDINPLYWHAHEMVFGFALAVIAGFLLTASNNWTAILPAAGLPLAVLFVLWAAARFAMVTDHLILAATCDISFSAMLVALLFRVLFLARLWKNFTLLGLVMLMGALNGWFYLILLEEVPISPLYPIELALLVIMQLLIIMGGRVIPMFTQNGVMGINVWKPQLIVTLTPLVTVVGIAGWLLAPPRLAFLLCSVAASVNFIRWLGWKPWRCLKQPMVWVLQLGYLWIPMTFLCMGLQSMGFVSRSLPMHALAVGAMGLIISGMITRTAMGHTGRPISASPIETTLFSLIAISGISRACAAIPLFQTPDITPVLLMLSATTWALGFALYVYRYTPWLFRPRLDGKPG